LYGGARKGDARDLKHFGHCGAHIGDRRGGNAMVANDSKADISKRVA
jgi:hypothetical protein